MDNYKVKLKAIKETVPGRQEQRFVTIRARDENAARHRAYGDYPSAHWEIVSVEKIG